MELESDKAGSCGRTPNKGRAHWATPGASAGGDIPKQNKEVEKRLKPGPEAYNGS